jgi:hypothetical protein
MLWNQQRKLHLVPVHTGSDLAEVVMMFNKKSLVISTATLMELPKEYWN